MSSGLRLLSNGLGASGDEEKAPVLFPDRPLHVVLVTTGSVASIKAPLIVAELLKYKDVQIQVVATKSSTHFYDPKAVETAHEGVKVWQDEDEWSAWKAIGDPVVHIELRRWADLVLIAPCSADSLAKIAGGICDNISTSFLRALPTFVPVWLFPAMNTHMYSHPLTAKHLEVVTDLLKYKVFGPIPKLLACGDLGVGAMSEWKDIVQLVVSGYGLQPR